MPALLRHITGTLVLTVKRSASMRTLLGVSRPFSSSTDVNKETAGQQEPTGATLPSCLTLHKADVDFKGEKSLRPLVIMFQWLYAKPPHLMKYCSLYNSVGLDVLAVRGKLSHFLWPPMGVKLSLELFDYLKGNRPVDEKLFIHAFSVGAYNYTIMMEEAFKNPEQSGHMRDRVIGQIFDSITIGTYDNMSQGIAQVLPENKAFRKIILNTLDLYYNVTHKTTKDTYDNLVKHFKEEPIPVPTLLFYSHDDPMCDTVAMEGMLANWESSLEDRPGFEVSSVSWPESKHVAHLREHRDEYMAAWTQLMTRLKLL